MEKYKFKKTDTQEEEEKPKSVPGGHGNCQVHGCPMPGHIHTGGWNCRYHHGKHGEALPRITGVILAHEYLFKWHSTVLNGTLVDWDVGDIQNKAPNGLRAIEGETWPQYKKRICDKVAELVDGAKKSAKVEYKHNYQD